MSFPAMNIMQQFQFPQTGVNRPYVNKDGFIIITTLTSNEQEFLLIQDAFK